MPHLLVDTSLNVCPGFIHYGPRGKCFTLVPQVRDILAHTVGPRWPAPSKPKSVVSLPTPGPNKNVTLPLFKSRCVIRRPAAFSGGRPGRLFQLPVCEVGKMCLVAPANVWASRNGVQVVASSPYQRGQFTIFQTARA